MAAPGAAGPALGGLVRDGEARWRFPSDGAKFEKIRRAVGGDGRIDVGRGKPVGGREPKLKISKSDGRDKSYGILLTKNFAICMGPTRFPYKIVPPQPKIQHFYFVCEMFVKKRSVST